MSADEQQERPTSDKVPLKGAVNTDYRGDRDYSGDGAAVPQIMKDPEWHVDSSPGTKTKETASRKLTRNTTYKIKSILLFLSS